MLELESDVLEVKFNGEVITLNYPTLDDLEKCSDLKEVKEFKGFFMKLGMKEEIADKLQLNHALAIIEALTEKKN